jgi:hypothetical protein
MYAPTIAAVSLDLVIRRIWLIMRNVVAGFEDLSVGGAHVRGGWGGPGRWQDPTGGTGYCN